MKPGAQRAPIEAEMRVELKQWLLSHWGDMKANARANLRIKPRIFPRRPGITGMREQYDTGSKS